MCHRGGGGAAQKGTVRDPVMIETRSVAGAEAVTGKSIPSRNGMGVPGASHLSVPSSRPVWYCAHLSSSDYANGGNGRALVDRGENTPAGHWDHSQYRCEASNKHRTEENQ